MAFSDTVFGKSRVANTVSIAEGDGEERIGRACNKRALQPVSSVMACWLLFQRRGPLN